MARIVLAGYLVRQPLGGYAWQAAHYLLGLRALGHDAWFYEETAHWAPAYNPMTGEFGPSYEYGLLVAADFLGRLGFDDRWAFVDSARGIEYGTDAGRIATLLTDADLLIDIAGVNRVTADRRGGRPSVFVDIDPGYTQIRAAQGDAELRRLLDEHAHLFTIGENIGTARSPLPTGGYRWHPTRCPVAVEQWAGEGAPGSAYTTIGTWDSQGRDVEWEGEAYRWRKRTEWQRFLELPRRSGARLELAMDVARIPEDLARLDAYGWRVEDPLAVSTDPWRYRDYIVGSRGEFTVAKDLNVRLRSGWFSDRAACYLAAGRPVVEQDTAFGDVLPLGPGVHAFRTIEEAAEAIHVIESDWPRASAHALEVAREYFAAEKVVAEMLRTVGL